MLRAYWKLEPFGYEVENFRHAVIANTVARAHGAKTKVADYYPVIKRPVEVDTQTQQEQMSILSAAGNRGEAK